MKVEVCDICEEKIVNEECSLCKKKICNEHIYQSKIFATNENPHHPHSFKVCICTNCNKKSIEKRDEKWWVKIEKNLKKDCSGGEMEGDY